MKKLFCISFLFLFVCILTGCDSTKVLECTVKSAGNNMNVYGNIKYIFKNDKIVSQHSVFEFKDIIVSNIDENWNSYVEQFTKQNKPVEDVGYKRTVESDDKNHIFKIILDVDYTKITKDVMNNYNLDAEYVNLTYDGVKKSMLDNKDTISCK